MREPVVFEVTLETAQGPLRGRIPIPPGPMRLAELVPQALGLCDLLVRRAIASEAQRGRVLSCAAGCAACCRYPVPLSAPEAFFLVERVGAHPDRERLLGRFRDAHAELVRRGLASVWLDRAYDDERAYQAAAQVLRLRMDCPLLDGEQCSLHAERPTRCREHNVTSPAAWCAAPERHPVRSVPLGTPLSAALARVAADLGGAPVALVPLALLLPWTERHRALGERTWPGPVLFEAFVERLSDEPPG